MARKKKEIQPSKYQSDIFEFIQHGNGNLVVEAKAGSGKSWTLVKCLDFIDEDKRVLLTAFNRDIVTELEKKVKDKDNIMTSTLHSLGRLMLSRNYPNESLILDELKYRSYINTNIKTLSSMKTYQMKSEDYFRYIQNISTYVNFGRSYLCQTEKDLDFIRDRYDIENIGDEQEVAVEVMQWGKENIDTIDYTDMIWLPNILMCKPIGLLFDWIFIDEAQDLSVCQREIIMKCKKINTRMCMFGDPEQSLYAFSSADPESFRSLKNLPNTTSLPLSVSYRCAKNIINLAKTIVPTIEDCGDGRDGEIIYDVPLSDINDGDMVLCRNNAPLMQVYVAFMKEGKKCFIRGKDIGLNMKNTINRTKQTELNADLSKDGVFVRLYDQVFDNINELVGKYHVSYLDALNTAGVQNKLDVIHALSILSEGINTSDELIDRIKGIFSDRKKGGISLSTIHKAKGLEADNVYIACPGLMPSKMAKKAWEHTQESNLIYVAYTRAKNKLGFIDDNEIDDFTFETDESIKRLQALEERVNKVLNKQRKEVDVSNPYVASDIIRHATVIEKPKPVTKIMKMSMDRNRNGVNKLNEMFKKKPTIRNKRQIM